MKSNKKLLSSLLVFLLLLSACGSKNEGEGSANTPEVSEPSEETPEFVQAEETPLTDFDWDKVSSESELKDIIMGLYSTANIDKEFLEALSNFHMMTSLKETDTDSQIAVFGKEYSFKEALISESGITTNAYSLMLVRANSESEAAKLAGEIKESVNPAKWVCVSAESVISSSQKDLVLVVMGEQAVAQVLIDTFNTIK